MHFKHAFVGAAIQIILCALRCVFFWFWQLYTKRCRIFLGPVVNKFAARSPVDGSVF